MDHESELNEKAAALRGDEGFQNALNACTFDAGYTQKILRYFDDPGFGSLTNQLNNASDKYFRHAIRNENRKILAANQKQAANKD